MLNGTRDTKRAARGGASATGPPRHPVEMVCPVCDHRAFDLSDKPPRTLWVTLKCPNCHHIVRVRCPPEDG